MWWIEEFRTWTRRLIRRENWVGERILHDDGYWIVFKIDGLDYACPFCDQHFTSTYAVLRHLNYYNGQCDTEPKTKRMRMVDRPILILRD